MNKIQKFIQYCNDYQIPVFKTPIKGLYYLSDNTDKIGFIIDYMKSEKIEYFWQFGTVHFTDKHHLGYW